MLRESSHNGNSAAATESCNVHVSLVPYQSRASSYRARLKYSSIFLIADARGLVCSNAAYVTWAAASRRSLTAATTAAALFSLVLRWRSAQPGRD